MADVLGFAGVGSCVVALIFAIAAVAVNNWVSKEVMGVDVTIGLWKFCNDDGCVGFNEDTTASKIMDPYRAVRSMIILAILALPGAVVCVILKMFVMKDKDMLTLVGGIVAGVAGLFLMVAMAVYYGELYEPQYKDLDFDLSAGFALDIVAWILAWVGAGLLIASKFLSQSA